MADPGWDRAALVRACYRRILGRPAENEEVVARHAGLHASPMDLLATFLDSDEFLEGQRRAAGLRRLAAVAAPPVPGALRVLLFGAYGNGNLGDAAQASAVAGLLRGVVDRPLDVRATSWLATDPFDFPPEAVVGPDALLDPAILAGFDLLLLGGGGLFAPVHFPLLHPEWVAFLHRSGLPYGLVGLGAATTLPRDGGVAEVWARLTAGADFLSARDEAGLATMPPAHWLPDPVLVAGLLAGGGVPRPVAAGARPLCIVKQPAHAVEADFLDAVAALGDAVEVVVMEPRRDGELAGRFPAMRTAGSMAGLQAMCGAASVVVSARYHGCIAGLLAGVPCYGIGPGKSGFLLDALGAGDRFLPHCGPLGAVLAAPADPVPLAAFAPLRTAAEAALSALGAMVAALPRRG